MDLFPYTPRPHQQAIITTISNAFKDRTHLIMESGTGTGKTICALTSALTYGLTHEKKIIYITRTNAQQQQVIKELRAIRKQLKDKDPRKEKIVGVGIQGRSNMCPHSKQDEELSKGTSEELSKFCSNEKKKTRSSHKGCPYYRNFVNDKANVEDMIKWFQDILPTAESFIEYCEQKMICPYELNKKIVRDATVVVVPYIYIFDITIRNMLFDWLGIAEEDVLLIVDEAHNLPDYLRDLLSAQLSVWMLRNCSYEAKEYGNPSMIDGRFTIAAFCKTMEDIIRELRDTYVYSILEDGIRKTPRGYMCLATDGHVCRSICEKSVDDWLYRHGIPHDKEVRYPGKRAFRADWQIGDYFIEFWGLKGEEDYDEKMNIKKEVAKQYSIPLIGLTINDLPILDSKLKQLKERFGGQKVPIYNQKIGE